MKTWGRLFVVFALVGACAQAQGKKPALSTEQKLKVQVTIQRVEITQLQLQVAQGEAQRARAEAEALLKTLTADGWQLDLQTLDYVPAAKPEVRK